MTSKAFELAKLGNAYSDGALSNRNLIINGAMQVAQRGTSVSTGNGYTLDRWYTNSQSSLLATASQEDDSTFNFGEKHLKFVSASGASYSYVSQKIENMKQFSGKTLTLSFDYTSTHSFSSSLEYHYGTGGSAAEYDLQGVTVPAAASATRYSRTFTIPDLSAKTFGPDNTSHLHILFNFTTNPATLKITNVQLEVGDTATPFEHLSFGDELARCQRYFYKFPVASRVGTAQRYGVTGSVVFSGLFPVEMRATPTMDSTGIPKAYNASFSAVYDLNNLTNSIGTDRANFACAFSGQSSGHGVGEAAVMNLSAATLSADAEL